MQDGTSITAEQMPEPVAVDSTIASTTHNQPHQDTSALPTKPEEESHISTEHLQSGEGGFDGKSADGTATSVGADLHVEQDGVISGDGKNAKELVSTEESTNKSEKRDAGPPADSTALESTPEAGSSVGEPVATSASETQDEPKDPLPAPTPSFTVPTSTLLPPQTQSNPGSASSTPTLAPANLPPPQPSSSPAPTKKFASSLSVNKKFLEKAGDKSKPEAKASVARPAPTPTPPISSTSHPRLLTGKISAAPTISLTTAQASPGITGWLKNVPVGETPRPPVATSNELPRGGTYERGGFGAPRGPGRSGGAVWGSRNSESHNLDMGIGGEFPTAAEAANAKNLRAQALLEQMQSRDRAVQARAAATAAANAHLLEGLDAFRGIHLDPNASHWDEMGDEDNDFLDDTIEFGDGTQYKIDAEAITASISNDDVLQEPHPSDFATLEAPLAPGESIPEPSREERFKDDYDRSWPKKPVPNDARNLFNDRLGKLEPYAGKKAEASMMNQETRRPILRAPSNDLPPHLDRAPADTARPRKDSLTSPRPQHATLPRKESSQTHAWGRERNEWRDGSSASTRRPSVDAAPRRTSIEHHSARRPSLDQGGRQLPPHLMGQDRHEAKHEAPVASIVRTATTATPSASSVPLSPPRSQSNVVTVAIEATLEAPKETAAVASPPEDLEELHAREMHAAAARAKERRQKEEEERVANMERAKKKAAELEEKMRLANEAKLGPEKSVAEKSTTITAPADRAESWRKAPPPAAQATKPQPTHILAREEPKSTPASSTTVAPGSLPTASKLDTRRSSRTTQDTRAEKTRQPPPHLVQTTSPPPQPAVTASPVPTVPPLPPTPAVVKASTLYPCPIAPAAPASSPPPPEERKIPIAAPAKVAFKKPEMSNIDELMLRIKAEMAVPKEPTASTVEAMSRSSSDDTGLTVKLPSSARTALSPPMKAVSLPPTTQRVAPALVVEGIKPTMATGSKDVPKPRGRPPFLSSQEPMPSFESTRRERSLSPRPVWKVYSVRLAMQPRRIPPDATRAHNFGVPPPPPNADALLSWDPPLKQLAPRRLSRDDLFFKKSYHKGVVIAPVSLPTRTITRRTSFDPPVVVAAMSPSPVVLPVSTANQRPHASPLPKAKGRAEGGSWRKQDSVPASQETLEATTAPTAAALFEVTPTRQKTAKSKLPAGSSIGFYSPNGPLPLDDPASAPLSRSSSERFMVTSELNGEVVEMVPREYLAAPGADLHRTTTDPVAPPEAAPFETPSMSRPLSPPATSGWQAKGPPLSLSVLDPTGSSSVWSAPPIDGPVHARSISLGAPKTFVKHSVENITDDDDFPPPIPTSVADLKSEDEGSTENHLAQERGAKDEARLRAAAPSFSSYVEPSEQRYPEQRYPEQRYPEQRYTEQQRYSGFQRSPVPAHPQLHLNYHSQPFQPQQQPAFTQAMAPPTSYYPMSSPSPGLPPFSTQPLQGYSPASYSPLPSSPSASFGYRSPSQSITNPALLAQSFGGGMASFGAVGAPVARNGSGYGMRPVQMPSTNYLPSSPYSNGVFRSSDSASFTPSPEVRSGYPGHTFTPGVASPSYQPQQQPQHQSQQYASAFPGSIGRRSTNGTNSGTGYGGGGRPW